MVLKLRLLKLKLVSKTKTSYGNCAEFVESTYLFGQMIRAFLLRPCKHVGQAGSASFNALALH